MERTEQKFEAPTTRVLRAQQAKAMGMIGEGSRNPHLYSQLLQDFVDGAYQFHGRPETLDHIIEKLGIQVEQQSDAERRNGVYLSEGIASVVTKDRTRMIGCILRDLDYLAHVMEAVRVHPNMVWLQLFCYDAQPLTGSTLRPR